MTEINLKFFVVIKKSGIRRHWKYTLDGLRKDITQALNQVKYFTIWRKYKNCLKKKDLYRGKVV